jgi:hypothetical protein
MDGTLPSPPVACLILFVAGGLGGALCDQIHVRSGVLSYPDPVLAGQSWWVAPQFGLAVPVMLLAARRFAEAARRARSGAVRRELVTGGAWFLAAYGASGLWHGHPALLAAGYGVAWLARLAGRPDRVPLAAWSILLALGGTFYEGTLAATGAFHYGRPDLYHVPIWLPGIYLHGAPLALAVARRVDLLAPFRRPVARST